MTTVEQAAGLRAELRALGIPARAVSVRARYFSMGSDIRVTIKDPEISLRRVETIARPHESIERDAFGEILGGGNRYIVVSYSIEAEEARTDRWMKTVAKIIEEAETCRPGEMVRIPGTGDREVWSGPADVPGMLKVSVGGRCIPGHYSQRGVARIIALNV